LEIAEKGVLDLKKEKGEVSISNPLILIIMDGWGISREKRGNAVELGKTPNFHYFLKKYPNALLTASGEPVGLPAGVMGNSEVGHLNIGAGRLVYQDILKITKAIKDKSFFSNKILLKAVENCKKKHSALHLMGLLSDGAVHSHMEHLFALLQLTKQNDLEKVYIHCFLDGRDVPPKSAEKYIRQLEDAIRNIGIGTIATIIGRYYAMDRDKRWERLKKAYDAIVKGEGINAYDAIEAIEKSYRNNHTDEFVVPAVIGDYPGVNNDDSLIFFNFRSDRARQLTWSFVEKDFPYFDRKKISPDFVCMCEYDNKLKVPVAFPPDRMKNTLGEVLAKNKTRQLRIAETEKYAHVTFFFNGGIEKPNRLEDRILIPSPKVVTYDMKPEMSAYEVTENVLKAIDSEKYKVIIVNFANPDMVGHTGKLAAAIKAVEAVDICVKKVVDRILSRNGTAIVMADHGNAEKMIDLRTGQPHTAHTTNPVPFILIDSQNRYKSVRKEGILADVAPTMLQVLGINQPKEMTGKSMIM